MFEPRWQRYWGKKHSKRLQFDGRELNVYMVIPASKAISVSNVILTTPSAHSFVYF